MRGGRSLFGMCWGTLLTKRTERHAPHPTAVRRNGRFRAVCRGFSGTHRWKSGPAETSWQEAAGSESTS
jgi:hypothetical protein